MSCTSTTLRVGESRIDLAFRRSRRSVTVDVKEQSGPLDVLVELTGPRHFSNH